MFGAFGHKTPFYPAPNGLESGDGDEPNLRFMSRWGNGGSSYDRLATAGFRCVYPPPPLHREELLLF